MGIPAASLPPANAARELRKLQDSFIIASSLHTMLGNMNSQPSSITALDERRDGGISLTLHKSPRALADSPFNFRPTWLDCAGNLPLASLGIGALVVLGLVCYLAGRL